MNSQDLTTWCAQSCQSQRVHFLLISQRPAFLPVLHPHLLCCHPALSLCILRGPCPGAASLGLSSSCEALPGCALGLCFMNVPYDDNSCDLLHKAHWSITPSEMTNWPNFLIRCGL